MTAVPTGPGRARRVLRVAAATATLGLGLSACSSGGSSTTTTTKPLPPLPPNVLAYVALAGAGGNLGFGHHLARVNVTPGLTGVEGHVPTGTWPDAVAVTPDGTEAYVTNFGSGDVTPIDLVTGTAGRPISVGQGPSDIAISPDGTTAYVTDAGTTSLGDTVTPIDLRTDKVLPPITVGPGPQGIVITPNGARAYVTDAGAVLSGQTGSIGDQVTPIDLQTRKALGPITVGNAPIGIAVSPDGGTVFVANLNSESVSPIDVATDTVGAAVSVPGGPIALVSTRSDVWVVDTPANGQPGNNVVPINLTTLTAGRPIRVGRGAQAIALTPNHRVAWVACQGSQTIVPVNTIQRAAGRPIVVGGGPFAIAIADEPHGATTPSTTNKKKPAASTTTTT